MNETPMPTGFVTTTPTLALFDEVLNHLAYKIPDVACELFPAKPSEYSFIHPKGAYLLAYQGGQFNPPSDTFIVVQDRTVSLAFNVLARQLFGRDGAIALCDELRNALVGYQPAICDRKIYAISEQFLGEDEGVWLYQVVLATQTVAMPSIY